MTSWVCLDIWEIFSNAIANEKIIDLVENEIAVKKLGSILL